ncbi:MAG: endonuclease/exonuclease/phosphatase family protein [Prevotella sp.]|nr:endonuclease/exonuclease/phosphatase family protein [Candidatus Equicola stercoris]
MSLLLIIFTIVTLNCENLFDTRHDENKDDTSFLPSSPTPWTAQRYWNKVNNIGREILSSSSSSSSAEGITSMTADKGADIHLPDVVALMEVENDSVMHDLCHRSLLRNANYEYVMTESDDPRGIDVALMYRPTMFHVIDTCIIRCPQTRDVLYVCGETLAADTLHIFVVHLPSRRGDSKERSMMRRMITEKIAYHPLFFCEGKNAKDMSEGSRHSVIVLGDFNDYADGQSLRPLLDVGFCDVSADAKAKGDNEVKGTYRYRGEWGSLDHILMKGKMKEDIVEVFINASPFLLQRNKNGEVYPRRTFRGSFYQGGYSDHLPLGVTTFSATVRR